MRRSCAVFFPKLLPHMIWDTVVLSWAVSAALVLFPSVEFVQLHCGRNITVIRLSTLKFIVLLLLLFPMVHSGISKCLPLSPPSVFPSQRWPSQPRLLGPEGSMSMLNLYTSPSLPNISLGFSAAPSPLSVS